jgi:hypothetical protein
MFLFNDEISCTTNLLGLVQLNDVIGTKVGKLRKAQIIFGNIQDCVNFKCEKKQLSISKSHKMRIDQYQDDLDRVLEENPRPLWFSEIYGSLPEEGIILRSNMEISDKSPELSNHFGLDFTSVEHSRMTIFEIENCLYKCSMNYCHKNLANSRDYQRLLDSRNFKLDQFYLGITKKYSKKSH